MKTIEILKNTVQDYAWGSLTAIPDRSPSSECTGKGDFGEISGKLPYLLKVLAAAKPLSIQAHPNAHQAREGFGGECISLMSSNRNYKDDNHKPECICALTRFWGMIGFRRIPEIVKYLGCLCGDVLKDEIVLLKNQPDSQGLKRLFQSLLTMPPEKKTAVISSGVSNAGSFHVSKIFGRSGV